MRLLSLTLLLLLSFSPSLTAPTDQKDPTEVVQEGSGTDEEVPSNSQTTVEEVLIPAQGTEEEASVPAQSTVEEATVTAQSTVEGATVPAQTTVEEATVPAQTTVEEATVPAQTTVEEATVPAQSTVEEASVPDQTAIVTTTVAPKTRKPCKCRRCNKCNRKPASDVKEISGTTKQCSCTEMSECRKSAMVEMDTCMDECKENIKGYGDKTDAYLKCFSNSNAMIVEAENCLFKKENDFCSSPKDTKFINKTNWDNFTAVQYTSEASKELKNNNLWKRDEPKYNTMQKFFHCTKNCIHKKIQTCTQNKGCAVRMPEPEKFASNMNDCIKKNPKIAAAILKTCQCLAWNNGVKDLQGSCVIIGNSYYIDRA